MDVVKKGCKHLQEYMRNQRDEDNDKTLKSIDKNSRKTNSISEINQRIEYDIQNEINDVWASGDEEESAFANKNQRTGSSRLMQRSKSAASINKRPFSTNSNYMKE